MTSERHIVTDVLTQKDYEIDSVMAMLAIKAVCLLLLSQRLEVVLCRRIVPRLDPLCLNPERTGSVVVVLSTSLDLSDSPKEM